MAMSKRNIKRVLDILGYISTLDWAARLIIIGAPGVSALLTMIISWWGKVPLYFSIPLAIFVLFLVLGLILKFAHLGKKDVKAQEKSAIPSNQKRRVLVDNSGTINVKKKTTLRPSGDTQTDCETLVNLIQVI